MTNKSMGVKLWGPDDTNIMHKPLRTHGAILTQVGGHTMMNVRLDMWLIDMVKQTKLKV